MKFGPAGVVNVFTVALPAVTFASGLAWLNTHAGSPLTVLSNFVAAWRPLIEYVRLPV